MKPYRKVSQAWRRKPNELYILGIPERLWVRAAEEVGWRLTETLVHEGFTRLRVRRPNTITPVIEIDIPADTRRRHLLDVFRVQLRLKGAAA